MHGAKVGAALVVFVVLLVLVTRPSFLFGNKMTSHDGPFASRHLRLAWRFQGTWSHPEGLDEASTTSGGWQRHTSTFFQGRSPTDFESQLTVVTIEHGEMPSQEDLRAFGTAELTDRPFPRTCVALDDGRNGQRCDSTIIMDKRSLSSLEEYFLLGPRVVFVHGLVPANQTSPGASGTTPKADRQGNPALEKLLGMIASMEPFESK